MLQSAHLLHGVSYDAVPSLATWLGGTPEALVACAPWTPWPEGLDERWRAVDLDRFVAAASAAAAKVGFSALLDGQAALRSQVLDALGRAIEGFDPAWYGAFFGAAPPDGVRVVASLVSGPNNYGLHRVVDGRREVVPVISAWPDDAGAPSFDGAEDLLVHEVGHTFVGAVVDAQRPALEAPGRRLYALVATQMRAEAYGSWPIVVEESLLRACVARYALAHHGPDAAEARLEEEAWAGFPWVRALYAALEAYEADRARFPTLVDFVPAIATAFDAAAADLERHRAAAPRILRTIPPDGAHDVDPSLTTFTVVFDRPMHDQAWAVCGGGPNYPELGACGYDAARTTFTVPMRLVPGHDYELWLNTWRYLAFTSEAGEPLDPVHIAFRTTA
jgi:hypothetical protein